MKQKIISYLMRVGDATSQWINVALLGGMNPNESVSGRAWRLHTESNAWNVTMRVIDTVFFWQDQHCKAAFSRDFQRAKDLTQGN